VVDNIKSFSLDPFQEEAINELKNGISVVVSAPTGAGKTAIAEFVIEEAIKNDKRAFYTTPLKALSNQKFHDFQKKYGEERVGLVTGDSSSNRDAQIVVMTTEIYRNMLYGTSLGSVDENLKHLRYLVLDECHYMNDPERGTVWEESIIYSPKNVQIVALSATVANASELADWISKVHNNTKLIESFFRPVPLRFYYFKDKHLYPLLTTDKKLNPQLKSHKDGFKAFKQKFSDRKKNFNEVRTIDIVDELNKRSLLPAIYFVFSRRGCETAMKDCQDIGYTLLTETEKKLLASLIQERIKGNEYLSNHKHLGYLHQGMAVHHAGLLPQWKNLIEFLFSKGLIKVVFATETLAAGINMPARTTIISNLGKRGDVGHKDLSSNQFLQMSGRAGRRGMDELGNVVIKETIDHTPAFAAKLAVAPPEPLVSQFTPNYSMVLNLLQNHSMDQIKTLLNRSFGQYLINKDIAIYQSEKEDMEGRFDKLSIYPCPIPEKPGDIAVFRKQDEKIHELKRLISTLVKQNNPEINDFKKQLSEENDLHQNYPCFTCKNQDHCFRAEKEVRRIDSKLKIIKKYTESQGDFYWNEFLKLTKILNTLGYIENNVPTEKGILAASLRGQNIVLIAEVLLNCDFSKIQPALFAGAISGLAIDSIRPRTFSKARPSNAYDQIYSQIHKNVRAISMLQRDNGIEDHVNYISTLAGLMEYWCDGKTKWEDMHTMANLDEGDLVRTGRRTMDLLRHIKNAPYLKQDVLNIAKAAYNLMDKEPIKEVV